MYYNNYIFNCESNFKIISKNGIDFFIPKNPRKVKYKKERGEVYNKLY